MSSASTSGRGSEFLKKHRHKLLATCAGAAVALYIYRTYSKPSNSSTLTTWQRWRQVVVNYAEALSSVSGTCSVLASDIHAFMTSNSGEMPQSLRQLSRLLQSEEVQNLLRTSASTMTQGVAQAAVGRVSPEEHGPPGPTSFDVVIEAVLSDRGRSLLGMAVGMASRNATSAFCEFLERMQQAQQEPGGSSASPSQFSLEAIMRLLASEQGDKVGQQHICPQPLHDY